MRLKTAWIGIAALGAVGLFAALIVAFGASEARHDPERCTEGLIAQGPRCCAPGQRVESGRCEGRATSCPAGMELGADPDLGCAVAPSRVHFEGGWLELTMSDWETEGVSEPKRVFLPPFELDATEVTHLRWRNCPTCRRIEVHEIGLPVSDVTFDEAERFCTQANGRLPTGDEWLFAAAGEHARRYPWGSTGLVCRRAAYGLVEGPCAAGADGPEIAGSRADGKSPEGALDLIGNVAEWTRESDRSYRARGGSFRSRVAGELKAWSSEALQPKMHFAYVGFRCAYDVTRDAGRR